MIPEFTGRLISAAEYEAASQVAFVALAHKNIKLREEALALAGLLARLDA